MEKFLFKKNDSLSKWNYYSSIPGNIDASSGLIPPLVWPSGIALPVPAISSYILLIYFLKKKIQI